MAKKDGHLCSTSFTATFYYFFSFPGGGGGGRESISLIAWLVVTFGSPLATVLSELIKLENNRGVTKKLEGKEGGGGLNWFKPGLGLVWKRKG